MTRALVALCAAALMLSACGSENPGDAVHDGAAAIEAGKRLCHWQPIRRGETWHAVMRRGWWHVYLNGEYANDETTAEASVDIRASDGRSYGCKP